MNRLLCGAVVSVGEQRSPARRANGWEDQLTDVLATFRALRWPPTYLRAAPAAGEPTS